jgi:hypothetical protein
MIYTQQKSITKIIYVLVFSTQTLAQVPPQFRSAEIVILDNENDMVYTKIDTDSGENVRIENRKTGISENVFRNGLKKSRILLILMETGYDETLKRIVFDNAVTDYEQLALLNNWLNYRTSSDWGQRGNLILNNFGVSKRKLSPNILIIAAEFEKVDLFLMQKGNPKSLQKLKSIGLSYDNVSLDMQKRILRITPIKVNSGRPIETKW